MWPLTVRTLLEALTPVAAPSSGALDPAVADQTLREALAWVGARPGRGSLVFAWDEALHELAADGLARGAVCVVDAEWSKLATLGDDLRARCFVSRSPLRAFRKLAAFMRSRFSFPVVAIGGSNGKTTTKAILAHVLGVGGARVTQTPGTNNGWIGVPISLTQPAHAEPAPAALVLEIGIDAPGAMRDHVAVAAPDVAVLTCLGPEHLAGLESHARAVAEELELFAAPKRVWLAEDPELRARLHLARKADIIVHEGGTLVGARGQHLAYRWRPCSPEEGILALRLGEEATEVTLPLPGAHNGRNAALAIGAAIALGRNLATAAARLESVRPVEQRCAIRRLRSGCMLIDDTFNASPSSVEAAFDVLDAFDAERSRVVVLGDMLDLGEAEAPLHAAIGPRLAALRGAHVRLYGRASTSLASVATQASSVGRASPPDDPASLIDLDAADLEDAVVLVKGSRGMRLERVVDRLVALADDATPAAGYRVGVVGVDADCLARTIRTALRESDLSVGVRALPLADLLDGRPHREPFDVAVLGRFVPERDPERELAAFAQLFVSLRHGGCAILPADHEVGALLADLVPERARVVRVHSVEARVGEVVRRWLAGHGEPHSVSVPTENTSRGES